MIVLENTLELITTSQKCYEVFNALLNNRQDTEKHKEYFYCMTLNTQNECQCVDIISIGTIDQCNPFIRECLRLAIIKNSKSLIICHNHPSGYIKPSTEDLTFTKKLQQACQILDINVLDHIIIGDNKYYSFADNGNLI